MGYQNTNNMAQTITEQMINERIQDLLDLTNDKFIYPAYYPHTGCMMWKIDNPYTNCAKDTIVLCSCSEGIYKALSLAVPLITKKMNDFYGKNIQ